jgi:hypothetical protein
MHNRINSPVKKLILNVESFNPIRTKFIVLSTAAVGQRVPANVRVGVGSPSLPAPLCVGEYQEIVHVPFFAGNVPFLEGKFLNSKNGGKIPALPKI